MRLAIALSISLTDTTLGWPMEESTELLHMARDWLDDHCAIFLNHKTQTITRVDTEVVAYFLGGW